MEAEKQIAYRTIASNAYIMNTLREFFKRIFLFVAAFVPGNEIHNILHHDQPRLMAGWIPIETDDDINYLLSEECTQRELLTSIYRLAIHLPRIIWDFVIQRGDAIDILKACPLDYDVLKRKMSAILYQYNLLEDNMSDVQMLQILQELYLESQDDVFHRRQLMYAFTTPHGHNPIQVFKNSRVLLSDVERQFMFPVSAASLVEPLSLKESVVMNVPEGYTGILPWITGNMIYGVGINTMFHKYTTKHNKEFATGVSGSTQVMLECASIFGIDVRSVFLALLPWMDISSMTKDHTVFEIVLAAQPHLPINAYKVSADLITNLTELQFIEMVYDSLPNPLNIAQPMQGVVEQVPVARFPRVMFGGKKTKTGGNAPTSLALPFMQASSKNVPTNTKIKASPDVKRTQIGKLDANLLPCSDISLFVKDKTTYELSLIEEWKSKFKINITDAQFLRLKAEKLPTEMAAYDFLPKIESAGNVETTTRKLVSDKVWKTMESLRTKYVMVNTQEQVLPNPNQTQSNSKIHMSKVNTSKPFSFAIMNGGKKKRT